jgi:predicted TPR repeat methyltransferase
MIAATMDSTLDQARAFFTRGIACYEAGRWQDAETQFAAALALAPGRPSVLTNLGATRLKLRRFEDAIVLLDEALAAEPANAEALGHRATAQAELGRHAKALADVDRALAVDARNAPLWSLRGTLLKEFGRSDEAAAAWREAIACGGDEALHRYYLAALGHDAAPATPPPGYAQALFDSYADGFEDHLVEVLRYRAPQLLAEGLHGRRFRTALDLGCGTGLCGVALRPLVDQIDGVDVSERMVAQARARGVYRGVVQGDVTEVLGRGTERYELIVAADVFIYVGALDTVFARVAQRLAPGGVFCFTVELADDASDMVLRPSLRYAHSMRYIRTLARQHGFEFSATAEHAIRDDRHAPIPGLYAWLTRP